LASSSVYRTRSQALVGRLVAGWLTALAVFLSVKLISHGNAWPGVALMALIFIPPVVWLARASLTGVHVEEGGVRIVNITRTLTIPWRNLERFSVGQRGILPRVGIAHLRDGRQIAIWAIQGPNPLTRSKNRDAERMMDALNAELDARRVG
jgi:Bacterial PH domain